MGLGCCGCNSYVSVTCIGTSVWTFLNKDTIYNSVVNGNTFIIICNSVWCGIMCDVWSMITSKLIYKYINLYIYSLTLDKIVMSHFWCEWWACVSVTWVSQLCPAGFQPWLKVHCLMLLSCWPWYWPMCLNTQIFWWVL